MILSIIYYGPWTIYNSLLWTNPQIFGLHNGIRLGIFISKQNPDGGLSTTIYNAVMLHYGNFYFAGPSATEATHPPPLLPVKASHHLSSTPTLYPTICNERQGTIEQNTPRDGLPRERGIEFEFWLMFMRWGGRHKTKTSNAILFHYPVRQSTIQGLIEFPGKHLIWISPVFRDTKLFRRQLKIHEGGGGGGGGRGIYHPLFQLL